MDTLNVGLVSLIVAWSVITAALLCLCIYRGTLESHEDDQIFLDTAEESIAREQRALVARINKLSRPITALVIASGALLVAIASLWVWQGLKNF